MHDAVTPGSIIHQRLLNSRRFVKAICGKATACHSSGNARNGVGAVLHRRTGRKASYKHLQFVFITYLSSDLCFSLFSALTGRRSFGLRSVCVILSPSEQEWRPIRRGLSSRSTCAAGKWISIYGSVSLIVAHSFLSGPQSTSQAEH